MNLAPKYFFISSSEEKSSISISRPESSNITKTSVFPFKKAFCTVSSFTSLVLVIPFLAFSKSFVKRLSSGSISEK